MKINFGGNDINSRLKYWDSYYKRLDSKPVPSQFAAFILNEFDHFSDFVDIGCGNGRDSFFFNKFRKRVLGLDGSEIIIQKNKKVFEKFNSQVFFKEFNLFEEDTTSAVRSFIDQTFSSPIFYSRFFLHVLNNKEIYEFFRFFSSFLDQSNAICLEYRTVLDQERQKVHTVHYRNYINPEKVNLICREFGLYNDYYCEGLGYAKYKTEDAYVARHIIKLKA